MLSSSAHVFLVRLSPHNSIEHRASALEEDFSYISNLPDKALEVELPNLAYYTQCTSYFVAI